jgi:hypothetical protein
VFGFPHPINRLFFLTVKSALWGLAVYNFVYDFGLADVREDLSLFEYLVIPFDDLYVLCEVWNLKAI